jgi:hypothetical protein
VKLRLNILNRLAVAADGLTSLDLAQACKSDPDKVGRACEFLVDAEQILRAGRLWRITDLGREELSGPAAAPVAAAPEHPFQIEKGWTPQEEAIYAAAVTDPVIAEKLATAPAPTPSVDKFMKPGPVAWVPTPGRSIPNSDLYPACLSDLLRVMSNLTAALRSRDPVALAAWSTVGEALLARVEGI